jgi:membrane protein required for colicin V production
MGLVDWGIVVVMVLAVLGGFTQGFFRAVCGLGGLLLGLAIAAWNYGRIPWCASKRWPMRSAFC